MQVLVVLVICLLLVIAIIHYLQPEEYSTEDFLADATASIPREKTIDTIITCSVPWQKVVVFNVNDYIDYNETGSGTWEISLPDGTYSYIPVAYTTIISQWEVTIPSKLTKS